jgi:N-acetylmuramoyl-L-alanine amidase
MKNIFITILIVAFFYTFWFMGSYPKALTYIDAAMKYLNDNMFAAILHQTVTVNDLHTKYDSAPAKKIRILLMPGHEPNYGGAEYGDLKEREMTVELAKDLEEFFKNDGHYDVIVARDTKAWNPIFADYFQNNWESIIAFVKDAKEEGLRLVNSGAPESKKVVVHNKAKTDVALRLHGINKWINENHIDIALHIHFNDNPRGDASQPGKYSGFSIYVPEQQYYNSTTTKTVAGYVFNRLQKYNAVSNLPVEDAGVVEDSDLIAIGVNNSVDSASMLIEYGYIYESQFAKEDVRHQVIKDLAFQTYLGLEDFFSKKKRGNASTSVTYGTLLLPHSWQDDMSMTKSNVVDALSLQSALVVDGVYPSDGRTNNDCPRTGKIGACTMDSVEDFQKKYGITGEEGKIGSQTRAVLNKKYSL